MMFQTTLNNLGTCLGFAISFLLLITLLVKSICCDRKRKDYNKFNTDHEVFKISIPSELNCCNRKRRGVKDIREVKKINVLCADSDDTEDDVAYKKCFERFIRQDLSYTIKWISKKSELNAKERFLFLLDVKTRIPEDFQRALERLDLTGNENIDILVVAMHHSESGHGDNVNSYISTLDHHSRFALTNILYSKPLIDNNDLNKLAKDCIIRFLVPK